MKSSRAVAPFVLVGLSFTQLQLARAQTATSPATEATVIASPKRSRPHVSAADVRHLGDAFADIAEKVSPSVVQIEVTVGAQNSSLQWFKADGVRRGMGSGIVFSADGAILTNNHVIEDARSISVRLRDGRIFPGRLVGRDPSTDLAVVRIDARGLISANFANSEAARVGEWVLAIGSPFGLDYTITTGVLSAKGRGGMGVNAVEDYLQTDASINPGNSGGPLVNLDGQVLGINTMIVSKGQGIGLAVPSSMARRVAEQILRTGHVDRAWLGLGLQDLTPQLAAEIANAPAMGALVNSVAPTGPASKVNFQPGDVIVSIAKKPVRDAQDVIREVFAHDVNDVVVIEVLRAGKRYQARVALESRHDPLPPALPVERQRSTHAGLGLTFRDLQSAGNGNPVAQIADIAAGSAADQAGLRPGDIVLNADAVSIPNAAQIQAEARDGRLLLRIRRQQATFYTSIRQ
jgi:S1-C subfamily serine protease